MSDSVSINRIKQERGHRLRDLVKYWDTQWWARRRKKDQVLTSATRWETITKQLNLEFPQLQPQTIEQVKNSNRHYKRLFLSQNKSNRGVDRYSPNKKQRHPSAQLQRCRSEPATPTFRTSSIASDTSSQDGRELLSATNEEFVENICCEVKQRYETGEIGRESLSELIGQLNALFVAATPTPTFEEQPSVSWTTGGNNSEPEDKDEDIQKLRKDLADACFLSQKEEEE